MTAYIFKIITLLGGLALFLFGMDIMGKSLERQNGLQFATGLTLQRLAHHIHTEEEQRKTAQQGDDLKNVSCHIFLL